MYRLLKGIAAALVLSVAAAQSASAQLGLVQYQSFFSFSGSPGTFLPSVSQNFTDGSNTATLTFNGQPSTLVNAYPFTFNDFGSVTAAAGAGSAAVGGNIYMEIVQSIPNPGSNQSLGTISGSISFLNSTATISWNPQTLDIGGVLYTVEPNANGVTTINAPTTGPQTIRGRISSDIVATPEPASMTLLATGLVGIFGAARRRRKIAA